MVTTLPRWKTQRSAILALLVAARGDWVPLPRILALGFAQYSARICELRKLGFRIQNKTKTIDGVKHSWFRLEPADSPLQAPVAVAPAARGQAMFPFEERHKDE